MKLEKRLQTFDLSCFLGKSHFMDDETQNYLVFQPSFKYFQFLGNSSKITEWKSKGLSEWNTKPPTSGNSLNAVIYYNNSAKIRLRINGSCVK